MNNLKKLASKNKVKLYKKIPKILKTVQTWNLNILSNGSFSLISDYNFPRNFFERNSTHCLYAFLCDGTKNVIRLITL